MVDGVVKNVRRLKMASKSTKFNIKEHYLYSFIVVGFLNLLLNFLFWTFSWLSVRLWIVLSILLGTWTYINDKIENKK
jgi:hypothetical protein